MIIEGTLKDLKKFKEITVDNNEDILIYKEKEVMGYVHYYNNVDYIEILNIEVLDKRNGIGTYLLNYLKEFNKKILLEVNVNNDATLFYKHHGFKIINTREKYYNNKDDAYVMEFNNIYILAIETSCDETSMSIIKNGNVDIHTSTLSQIELHNKYGGVVPELASRSHLEAITIVLDDLLTASNMKVEDMSAIAVTYAPGLLGSLLVGIEFAKTLSFVYDKPLIKVHHLAGHIYANNLTNKLKFPLLSLIVSGGHTNLVKMNQDYHFEVIGETLDDAIGEVYDKISRVLELGYPGGPIIEKLALDGTDTYKFNKIMNDETYNFSYSGIKSNIINLVHDEKQRGNEINKNDLAKSFEVVAIEQLVRKTKLALTNLEINNLIIAGGVSANKYLRKEMQKMANEINVSLTVPDFKYTTDNASMIGAAAYPLYLNGDFEDFTLNAKSSKQLY